MLHTLRYLQNVTTAQKPFIPISNQVRSFWEYVNMMFNKPDTDRIKDFGPNRACAEWVLRNGGKVAWSDGQILADYNALPPDHLRSKKQLITIDGTDSSISHYGFSHLIGCTMLRKIILHNNNYIEDKALKGLSYGSSTLTYVQISKCINVTDEGLKSLTALTNLQTLILFSLESVSDLEGCKQLLKQNLPNCEIGGCGSAGNYSFINRGIMFVEVAFCFLNKCKSDSRTKGSVNLYGDSMSISKSILEYFCLPFSKDKLNFAVAMYEKVNNPTAKYNFKGQQTYVYGNFNLMRPRVLEKKVLTDRWTTK